jgi:hypothetical protein
MRSTSEAAFSLMPSILLFQNISNIQKRLGFIDLMVIKSTVGQDEEQGRAISRRFGSQMCGLARRG